jgi:hypothetical protein
LNTLGHLCLGLSSDSVSRSKDALRYIAELLPRVQEIADQLNPSEIANLPASRPP